MYLFGRFPLIPPTVRVITATKDMGGMCVTVRADWGIDSKNREFHF